MPTRALRPCSWSGCGKPCRTGRCEQHPKVDTRGSYADRFGGIATQREWKAARDEFLRDNPLCTDESHPNPEAAPAATNVDHHIPHRGNPELFWDRSNWRPRCGSCHSRKTAKRDGGYGNTRKVS